MVLRNARLIFADEIRDGFEVVVRDGKIFELRQKGGASETETIDLAGNYLTPGFLDLHLHGAVGRDTMEGSAEAFRAICDYHASGGTTSLLLTTSTAPLDDITRVLRSVRRFRREDERVLGVHLEGPFISRAKCGAQRADFISAPTREKIDELLQFTDVIKVVTLAPEVSGVLPLVDRLREKNIRVSGGHSDATEFEARDAFEHGMRQVTHTFNCMSSSQHRGPERVAGLLELALTEPEILCELIADGHHVSATLMKLLYRAKGAARICLVTDATAGAGLPNESRFSLAGRECIVEKDACWLADRSALAGSAARMIECIRTLVRLAEIPLHEAIAMATEIPARALGLAGQKGCFALGADADFAVLSPQLEVLRTFVNGSQIFATASLKR